jgi:hypothetical protein
MTMPFRKRRALIGGIGIFAGVLFLVLAGCLIFSRFRNFEGARRLATDLGIPATAKIVNAATDDGWGGGTEWIELSIDPSSLHRTKDWVVQQLMAEELEVKVSKAGAAFAELRLTTKPPGWWRPNVDADFETVTGKGKYARYWCGFSPSGEIYVARERD